MDCIILCMVKSDIHVNYKQLNGIFSSLAGKQFIEYRNTPVICYAVELTTLTKSTCNLSFLQPIFAFLYDYSV